MNTALAPRATNATSDAALMQLWISGKSAATQSAYGTAIRQFQAFAGKDLAVVGAEDLQAWVAQLQQHYAPESVRTKVHALKSLLSYAQRIGYLRYNVGTAIAAPKGKDELAARIPAEGDVRQLIEGTTTPRDRVLLSLLYGCGLRVSEVCGLDWHDLQARERGGQATVYGKGRKTRVVLVPSKLWAALMQLPRRGEAVFASRSGQRLDRMRVHRIIKAAAQAAGITPAISAHWLRHAHATAAIERGCELHLLQQSLGHASLAVTSKYLHARPERGSSEFVEF